MLSLHKGDIVLVKFPHEDERSVYDERPCLVLAVNNNKQQFLAAKITTTELNRYWAFHLNSGNKDTSSGKILRESWINLNRREWLLSENLIRVLASLKPEKLKEIIKIINIL